MTALNTNRIYAEFPFLERICRRGKIKEATVTRLSGGDLEYAPIYSWSTEAVKSISNTKFYLLGKQGQVITRVSRWFRDGENVAQAFWRIRKKLHRVSYAVCICEGRGSLTLYKLPKEFADAQAWYLSIVEEQSSTSQDEQ